MQKIIVVDDHPPSKFLLSSQLASLGHEVVDAACGEEALSFLVDSQFDVIFTDINMLGMSGLEFAARVRRLERERQRSPCRIFGYTANIDVGVLLESKRVGMDNCFAKPIKINDLKTVCCNGISINLKRRIVNVHLTFLLWLLCLTEIKL